MSKGIPKSIQEKAIGRFFMRLNSMSPQARMLYVQVIVNYILEKHRRMA